MAHTNAPELEIVAGNGLLHRRLFLAQTAGVVGVALLRAQPAEAAAQQNVPVWMTAPGGALRRPGASAGPGRWRGGATGP